MSKSHTKKVAAFKAQPSNKRGKKVNNVTSRIDPITLAVTSARLEAIVEEMGATLLRTAHSSIFVECKDFSVALLERNGGLLAMGQYIPHHQGGMQAALRSIIKAKGLDSVRPGDVYLTNDSYAGGTHNPDVNMFMPVFHENELIMWCGSCAHQIDLGGSVPGCYVVGATDTFQEGVCFPMMKIGENGTISDDFMRLWRRNVRLPDQQAGDLGGMLAAVRVGSRNVAPIVRDLGKPLTLQIAAEMRDGAERRTRREIEKIPNGVYEWEDYLDPDSDDEDAHRFYVKMTVDGSDVTLDFTGTGKQAKTFLNASYWNTVASCYSAFFLFLDPTIPRNEGFFRPIKVIAPEGTLVNPHYPAPIGASTTMAGGMAYDLVLGALSKACPEVGLATWPMIWIGLYMYGTHPNTKRPYIHVLLDGLATGGGARAKSDGLNANHISASNMLIPNVEGEEQEYPVRFIRRELKVDSGGPGKYRGGLALEVEIEVLCDCEFTMFGSRFKGYEARGFLGGKSGAPSEFYRISPDGTVTRYPARVGRVPLKSGDRLVLRPAGGGGFGNPLERDRKSVEEDLRFGFISSDGAKDYVSPKVRVAAE